MTALQLASCKAVLAAAVLSSCTLSGCRPVQPAPSSVSPRKTADARAAEPVCRFFRLQGDYRVYAVGAYAGLEPLGPVLNGEEASGAEVLVTEEQYPVVLVLMSHDPVVWRIGRTAASRIAAVLASGHRRPAVTGISKEVPLRIVSREDQPQAPCPLLDAYEPGPQLLAASKAVKRYTGREIDRFVDKATDGVFYAGPQTAPPESELVRSNDLTLQHYSAAKMLQSGEEELNKLEEEGKLRRASRNDILKWSSGASAKYKRFNKDLEVRHRMTEGETYVVLKRIKLPQNVSAAEVKTFLVPAGVPRPSGGGDSLFYVIKGFTCITGKGAPCPSR